MADGQHRQRLAEMQSRLAASLTQPSNAPPPPPAFDAERLKLAASMLRRKRRKTLAHLLPCLVRCLGDEFDQWFAAYCGEAPGPPSEGTLPDATAFARFVAARRPVPPDAAGEVLRMELATKRLAWIRLESPRRLLIGFRLLHGRVRLLRVPTLWSA